MNRFITAFQALTGMLPRLAPAFAGPMPQSFTRPTRFTAVQTPVTTLSEAPVLEPEPEIEPDKTPAMTEEELIEMKRICACNGEAWRLRMIEAYEQAMAGIQFMYSNQTARARMEAQLLEDLLRELGESESD